MPLTITIGVLYFFFLLFVSFHAAYLNLDIGDYPNQIFLDEIIIFILNNLFLILEVNQLIASRHKLKAY